MWWTLVSIKQNKEVLEIVGKNYDPHNVKTETFTLFTGYMSLCGYPWSLVIVAGPEVGDHFTLNLYNEVIPPDPKYSRIFGFSSKFLLCAFFFWLFTCIRPKKLNVLFNFC